MPKNKTSHYQIQKWHFRPIKHAFLVPTNHITITMHIWIKRTNKQHQIIKIIQDLPNPKTINLNNLHIHTIWIQNLFF
jgi:hypothetical protein